MQSSDSVAVDYAHRRREVKSMAHVHRSSRSKRRAARGRKEHQRQERESNKRFAVYQDRNKILATMGFPTYAAYLASELWKGIRARVLRRDGYACRFCVGTKARAIQVHHGAYDGPTLRGEKLGRLYSSCATCHRSLEMGDGNKKIPAAAVHPRNAAPNQERGAARIGCGERLHGSKRRPSPPTRKCAPLALRCGNCSGSLETELA